MGVSAPASNENYHDEEGECHTSPKKNASPIGKKKAKEQQRWGNMADSPVGKLYMDVLENMWAKKKESEDLKEKKRTRWSFFCTRTSKAWWKEGYGTEEAWGKIGFTAKKDWWPSGFGEEKTWRENVFTKEKKLMRKHNWSKGS
jgi:hypothetical protein